MRQADPIARRVLDVVLRLEGSPWPGAMGAYGAMLVALSVRCERCPAAKAEVYGWYMRAARGSLIVYGVDRREHLRDAFHEAVARSPGLLLRFRAGLDPGRRPNLQSMMVAWIGWRAKDLYRSARQRHDARRMPYRQDERVAIGRPDFTAEANEVLALLAGDAPTSKALRLVGLGLTIAEAARKTGASRQQIDRARDALRARFDALSDG